MTIRIASLYTDVAARLVELRRGAPRVGASRAVVERALSDGQSYYGINTGFGALASKRIDPSSLVTAPASRAVAPSDGKCNHAWL